MAMRAFPPLKAASDELLHLDLLRFIASAAIVYHHSGEFLFPKGAREAISERSFGLALFVDMFFVISGFVIAFVYSKRIKDGASFGLFMQRRVGRLVPLHWLTLFLSLGVYELFWAAGFRGNHDPSASLQCIGVTAALLHSVIDCGGLSFNGVSWSISTEMVMYVLFPLLLIASRRFWLVAAFAVLLAVDVALAWKFNAPHGWTELYAPLRALPSFILGVLLYQWRDRLQVIRGARPLLWASLAACLGAMAFGAPQLAVVPLVYASVVFAIASDLQGKAGKIVVRTAPLGQLTYSIYMWHPLFILLFMNAVADKLLKLQGAEMAAMAVLCWVSILAWGYISFFWIETRARRWVDALPIFQGSGNRR